MRRLHGGLWADETGIALSLESDVWMCWTVVPWRSRYKDLKVSIDIGTRSIKAASSEGMPCRR